jgi:hypothetical protein
MRKRSVVFFVLGGAILAAAFFAEAVGLDNDPGWGRGRIAILVFGVFVIACGLFYSYYTDAVLSLSHKIQADASQTIDSLFKSFQTYWFTFPIFFFVILVYIWFASFGSWTHWESATHHYADLELGFKKGNLFLPMQPNRELLALSNPYDPSARQGISYPVDYSLYHGKYYLYWGPSPALLLFLIDPFVRGRVGDLYLVFSFVCGIFLLQSWLAITIWDRFFRDLPKWILALSIFVIGLTVPWLYMLINEPNGRIYEAAVAGAQFFLMGGFLAAVIAFNKPIASPWWLTLTGFLWALAIGTRLIIVVPIGFMSLMVAYRISKTSRASPMRLATRWIAFGSPLVLGFIGLGWYNWARFGSVTETGFSYQLGPVNMGTESLFSSTYVFQNLYSYLLQYPVGMPQFPFLFPKEVSPVVGLLFTAPFTAFAILTAVTLFKKATWKPSSGPKENNSDFLDWIITSLVGAFALAFFMILFYFWIAVRFVGDFIPALVMLSILGFWQGYQLLSRRPVHRRIYSILGIMFTSIGVLIHILLSAAVKQIGRTGI